VLQRQRCEERQRRSVRSGSWPGLRFGVDGTLIAINPKKGRYAQIYGPNAPITLRAIDHAIARMFLRDAPMRASACPETDLPGK
jgi:hypothetical protein